MSMRSMLILNKEVLNTLAFSCECGAIEVEATCHSFRGVADPTPRWGHCMSPRPPAQGVFIIGALLQYTRDLLRLVRYMSI